MESVQPSVFGRDDTFFGVCQALGEDFGFNPLFLRVSFALALFFNPLAAIAGYVGAGLVVAASRLIVREPRVVIPAQVEDQGAENDEPRQLDLDGLALAA